MLRVEYSTNCDIVDDVTEKLKDFDITYDELSDLIMDYKEVHVNIKDYEDKINDMQKEIRRIHKKVRELGIEDLFKEIYVNSDFEVFEADF